MKNKINWILLVVLLLFLNLAVINIMLSRLNQPVSCNVQDLSLVQAQATWEAEKRTPTPACACGNQSLTIVDLKATWEGEKK